MTGHELRQARLALGVSGEAFAAALFVSVRTLRGWEAGHRDGRPIEVPELVALVTELALKNATVRRRLGFVRGARP